MKSRFLALLAVAFIGGCASPSNGHDGTTAVNDPNSVYSDPTYPGRGVHIGIGAGSWGGRRGGGIGIGMGW
jgi:hypothetical protein